MRTSTPRVSTPGDTHEKEADRIADKATRSEVSQSPEGQSAVPSHASDGDRVREVMEPRFGRDFSKVKVHTDGNAASLSQQLGAKAFTYGGDIYMGAGQYQPGTPGGDHLLAHELSHVIQQERMGSPMIQREVEPGQERQDPPAQGAPPQPQATQAPPDQAQPEQARQEGDDLTGPLTEREWSLVESWLIRGRIGIDQLTDNNEQNALIVAEAIFCRRALLSESYDDRGEDPLMCVLPEVTRADPRVRSLVTQVTARGPITNLSGPLTEREEQMIDSWLRRGEVGIERFTDNYEENALMVAEAIFCHRALFSESYDHRREDPLMCVLPEVSRSDVRVLRLLTHITAPGPITNLLGPISDAEWDQVTLWQSGNQVGDEPLTEDADHNSALVARGILTNRYIGGVPGVAFDDRHIRIMTEYLSARAPIINWASVAPEQRRVYVMTRLVDHYGYSPNAAAGIVGNLWHESRVLPNAVEGRRGGDPPMRAPDQSGRRRDLTAEEVMNRTARRGPDLPGAGLAQWTTADRRAGLFEYEYEERPAGAHILFDMDAQIDYMVEELRNGPRRFQRAQEVLTRDGVTLNQASDEILFRYETPGAVIRPGGGLRRRDDPAVQGVMNQRRASSRTALRLYEQEQERLRQEQQGQP